MSQNHMTPAQRRADIAARGHQHAEAFCLMHYECKACRHHEVIWNSRDGVTPFGLQCPSCSSLDLLHAYFGSDRYAPDHKPHHGQRVWVSMTKERALALARRSVLRHKKDGPETERTIELVAEEFYRDGTAPDLRIEGYAEEAQ